MTKIFDLILASTCCLAWSFTANAEAAKTASNKMQQPAMAASPAAQQTYKDIQSTLGFVPEFLKAYPEASISGAWQEMKSFQMNPKTALSGKEKELIGLAVASQIPCQYCIYFHTKASKANGATDVEIKEAVAMSALTRHWSTWLNGNASDIAAFRQEVDKGFQYIKAKMDANEQMPAAPANMNDSQAVYADIKNIFGFVPSFYKDFPADALVGAWKAQRDLEMNPNTALSGKDKALIGVAVAAQIPCQYCNYFDTQAAMKLENANDMQIKEAITMAAMVRHWSTVLNGNQIDEKKFRAEVDRIFAHPAGKPMRTGSSTESTDTSEGQ